MGNILIAAADDSNLLPLREHLGKMHGVVAVATPSDFLREWQNRSYEAAFVDMTLLLALKQDSKDPKTILENLNGEGNYTPLIVLTTTEQTRIAVQFIRAGIFDYLNYPLVPEEVELVLEHISTLANIKQELDYLRGEFWKISELKTIQTHHPEMKQAFIKIRSVAPTNATVLLIGETGTGKGVLARLIHLHSAYKNNAFVSVHCGAIPENLVESWLFGHEKGAFTGATDRGIGKFELAKGGTIFLDEIGTMPLSAQVHLLHVLQEKTFQRVGGTEFLKANVRVVAATNMNLQDMIEQGTFREDLYYRLNVFPIHVPPLRDRLDDIPDIVENMLENNNKLYAKSIKHVHPQVLDAFEHYSWPGNIRELENLMERACIIETTSTLRPENFPSELFAYQIPTPSDEAGGSMTLAEVRKRGIENIERRYLRDLLKFHRGRINHTAKAAGISSRQLHTLLVRYDIHKKEFKSD